MQAQVTKEATMLITQALEQCILLSKYPKSAIDIHVFVLESDGGALSTAVTCASLALADAGIELLDMVAACTVVRISTSLGYIMFAASVTGEEG